MRSRPDQPLHSSLQKRDPASSFDDGQRLIAPLLRRHPAPDRLSSLHPTGMAEARPGRIGPTAPAACARSAARPTSRPRPAGTISTATEIMTTGAGRRPVRSVANGHAQTEVPRPDRSARPWAAGAGQWCCRRRRKPASSSGQRRASCRTAAGTGNDARRLAGLVRDHAAAIAINGPDPLLRRQVGIAEAAAPRRDPYRWHPALTGMTENALSPSVSPPCGPIRRERALGIRWFA